MIKAYIIPSFIDAMNYLYGKIISITFCMMDLFCKLFDAIVFTF